MTDKRTDALQDLGRRARDWFRDALNALFPEGAREPELVPVPVRPSQGPGRPRR